MDNIHHLHANRGLLLFMTFVLLLIVFGLTTPFDFSWPHTVELRENIISTTEAAARMEHGNKGRQVGMLLLASFAVFSLTRMKNHYCINLPSGWLLLLYLGWILFSLSWSIDVRFTLRRIITVDILWFGAIVTAMRYSLRELAWLAVLVTGSTLALAFANELRLHTMNPVNELWRFSGLFHTVAMGWNCGLLALAAMYLVNVEERNDRRALLWVIICAAIVFLLLTKSRMAVAASLLSMGLYWYRVVSTPNKIFLILSVIIVVSVAYLALGNRLLDYGETASTLGRGEEAKESVGNLTGRIPLWTECFKWAAERPVRGYGFNTFVSPKNMDKIARNVGWIPNSIHSGYIDSIMGLGYVGAALLIFFLISALVRGINLSLRYPDYIFVVSVLVWLYYNLFLEANLITRPTFMTFFCMTLLARLALLPGEEWERK
jgi:O-antigen ligase